MEITSIRQIIEQNRPQNVKLSGWAEGEEFICCLKRPQFYSMVLTGHIPNPLIAAADGLFHADGSQAASADAHAHAQVLHCIAEQALVSPRLGELQAAGIDLTDKQLTEIYAYTVGGAAALKTFRGEAMEMVAGDERGI